MEDPYWDPLQETYQLTRQLAGLIHAPLEQPLRLRLFLFLYCHVTEADDIVGVVANLIRITLGDRYSFIPFEGLPKLTSKFPPGHHLNVRIEQLVALANRAKFLEIAGLFESLFVRPVRNAFFHSDYVLSPESFNIRNGEGVEINHRVETRIPLNWLMPRLELGVNTALAIMELLIENIRSYKADKVVMGRVAPDGSYMDCQLTTDPDQGLTGFKSSPNPNIENTATL